MTYLADQEEKLATAGFGHFHRADRLLQQEPAHAFAIAQDWGKIWDFRFFSVILHLIIYGGLAIAALRRKKPTGNKRLEAFTEHSESNPGRSLGIKEKIKESCLEDSTRPSEKYKSRLIKQCLARYCLPDSHFILVCNPETSSRVTLASLGIGFQPIHLAMGYMSLTVRHKPTEISVFLYQSGDCTPTQHNQIKQHS